MRWGKVAFAVVLASLCGCGGGAASVSGTVKMKDGKPVTGVYAVLIPVDGPKANVRVFPLDDNGSFHGEISRGTYVFYLSPMSVETDEDGVPVNKADIPKQKAYGRAYSKIPLAYRTHENAPEDRRVEITSSGATLNFEVAK